MSRLFGLLSLLRMPRRLKNRFEGRYVIDGRLGVLTGTLSDILVTTKKTKSLVVESH